MLAREVIWCFFYDLYAMHDLSKVGENYNRGLPEVSRISVTTILSYPKLKT